MGRSTGYGITCGTNVNVAEEGGGGADIGNVPKSRVTPPAVTNPTAEFAE